MICTHCKVNGYLRLCFEAEESIEQCWVCKSQGKVRDDQNFIQTWEEGNGGSAYYYGPLLDPQHFKEYRIHPQKEIKHKE